MSFNLPFLILGEPNRVPLVGQVQEVLSLVTITSTQLFASSVLPQALQLLSMKFEFSLKQNQKEHLQVLQAAQPASSERILLPQGKTADAGC